MVLKRSKRSVCLSGSHFISPFAALEKQVVTPHHNRNLSLYQPLKSYMRFHTTSISSALSSSLGRGSGSSTSPSLVQVSTSIVVSMELLGEPPSPSCISRSSSSFWQEDSRCLLRYDLSANDFLHLMQT